MTGLIRSKNINETNIYEYVEIQIKKRVEASSEDTSWKLKSLSIISRELIKSISMPKIYGLTFIGMKDQIHGVIKEDELIQIFAKDELAKLYKLLWI
jgi:hypothetical protein